MTEHPEPHRLVVRDRPSLVTLHVEDNAFSGNGNVPNGPIVCPGNGSAERSGGAEGEQSACRCGLWTLTATREFEAPETDSGPGAEGPGATVPTHSVAAEGSLEGPPALRD